MPEASDDQQLLRTYLEHGSEPAFVELVRRHIDFVYPIALRQLSGDAHLAQDVAQEVFVALARQARPLSRRLVLESWLYCAARNSAIDVVRAETRRRAREQQAGFMHEITSESTTAAETDRLRTLLNAAIAELRESDRDAVMLRFFKNRSYAEIGSHLRLTENAARMRVERALEKLQGVLGRHGVSSSATAVAACLLGQPLIAAPAGLVASISSAAIASGTATGVGVVFMGMTKLQIGIACAVVVGSGIGLTLQRQMATRSKARSRCVMRRSATQTSRNSGSATPRPGQQRRKPKTNRKGSAR